MEMHFFIFIYVTQFGRRIGKIQTRFSGGTLLETPLCCARNPKVSHVFPHSLQEK